MNNWLQSYTKNCCDELDSIAKHLQDMEDAFIAANDNYYKAAQKALDPNIYQGKGAAAFVAAVNIDVNRSNYRIAGLGHVGSATKLLGTAITTVCQTYDGKLAAIAHDHRAKVPPDDFHQVISDVLSSLQLDNILCTDDAWSSAVKSVETWGTGQAFHDLTSSITSLLQDWAKEIRHKYEIFQQTLSNFKYLSARDLYYYINKTQDTNKPITITPYTTKDGKNGLLITIAGTDPTHCWDDNIITALMAGEALPGNRYMSDVEHAIETYMDKHSEMHGANITFVGYSLGGMVAQNWAKVLSANKEKTTLGHCDLHVTNVVTYGSPLMNKPVMGVQYAIYVATYDPVPLLSLYENGHLRGQIRLLIAELARNPLSLVTWEDFVRDFPKLCSVCVSIVKADQEPWEQKLNDYIDPQHLYRGKIFPISDVGNIPLDVHIGHIPIVHIPNIENHLQYYASDMLNARETAQALPNIDPGSWGPTEYFGMSAPVVYLQKPEAV